MNARPGLAALLDRTRRRLGLARGLGRAAWLALAAALSFEVGLLAARGLDVGAALLAGEVAAGGLLVLAALSLVLARRPSRLEAARALDLALGRGALLETAAEALASRHGALGALVLAEAERAASELVDARPMPIELPRGLGLGAAAALLLLVLALGPASDAPAGGAPILPAIALDPGSTAGGGRPERPDESHPGTPRELNASAASPGERPGDPAPGFPPEVSRALEQRLREIARELGARAPGSSQGETDLEAAKRAREALERALASGDEAATRAALEAVAARGTTDARATLERAADGLAASREPRRSEGPGAAAGDGPTAPGPADPSPAASAPAAGGVASGQDPARARAERLPWRVLEAERRYRLALEATSGS